MGILTTAAKAGLASDEGLKYVLGVMTTLNKTARDIMVKYRVHACTDVTGFGLMGHLLEMTQGSGVGAVIDTAGIDLIDESLKLAETGILPEGMYRNRSFAESSVNTGNIKLAVQDMLFDPQTSGGLLMAVDSADVDALFEELKGKVPSAQRIGKIVKYGGEKRILLR